MSIRFAPLTGKTCETSFLSYVGLEKKSKTKSETFLQGILVLIFSQVLIKVLGLVQTLYLTNRKGFGDAGNAIYMGSYQIYALLLSISSIGIPLPA